VRRN